MWIRDLIPKHSNKTASKMLTVNTLLSSNSWVERLSLQHVSNRLFWKISQQCIQSIQLSICFSLVYKYKTVFHYTSLICILSPNSSFLLRPFRLAIIIGDGSRGILGEEDSRFFPRFFPLRNFGMEVEPNMSKYVLK